MRSTHLAVALQLVVELGEVAACKVVVLALSAVALLELLAHKARLHRLDPLLTDDVLAMLLVRCQHTRTSDSLRRQVAHRV